MKKLLCLLLCLMLTGCGPIREHKQYTATFLTVFDTVTTVVGYAESEAAFREISQDVHDRLLEYHKRFDIYREYDGMTNLKTVNDRAGEQPVEVDGEIFAMLRDCKAYWEKTRVVNAAMGSVLRLWHEARQAGHSDPAHAALPEMEALEAAALHTDFSKVVLDEAASTVYFEDPAMCLDVGAIAKGWAVQKVAEQSPAGLLISVGGNVCATGPKGENAPWIIGLENPDGGDYLHTVYLTKGAVVTAGDYQRYYLVDGKPYHHIIDPETLMPGTRWRAVTVICPDSGLADALSTALFLLPRQEGQALLDTYGCQAMWVAHDGSLIYSPGFEAIIRT